jgi:glutamyl-tRNA reductase
MDVLQHPAGVFLAVGFEHSTAPLTVRERVAIMGEALEEAHDVLICYAGVAEVAVLSTCNRTELYLFSDDPAATLEAARAHLLAADPGLGPYFREWRNAEVVQHLYRVAAGLESQVLGERQILSQVQKALTYAEQMDTIGANLHQLFCSAIACARQVRAATSIGRMDRSIAAETLCAAESVIGPLRGLTALVIGGGEVSRLVVKELRCRDIGPLFLANRTPSVAAELAEQCHGVAIPLWQIGQLLPALDLVISATSAPRRILSAEDVQAADLSRRSTPLHLFDLALPRDIDPAIGSFPGILLHDLDSVLPAGIRERRQEGVRAAEDIVCTHVVQFERWYRTRRVVPLIAELRRQVEAIASKELERVSPRLVGLTQSQSQAVESLTNRLTDAIFHQLVTRLRLAASADDPQLLQAAAFFFGSDGQAKDSLPIDAPWIEHTRSVGGESHELNA